MYHSKLFDTCHAKRISLDLKGCHLFHYFLSLYRRPLCKTLSKLSINPEKYQTSKDRLVSIAVKILSTIGIT